MGCHEPDTQTGMDLGCFHADHSVFASGVKGSDMGYLPALNTRSRSTMLVVLMLSLALPSAAATTVNGFVTKVVSPTDFYVESLHVSLNGKARCEMEGLNSDILRKFKGLFHLHLRLQSRPVRGSQVAVSCHDLSPSVGSRVQVSGDGGRHEGSFTAVQLIVYKVDIRRKFATSWKLPEWAGVALIEEQPRVHRMGHGLAGTLWLDGYPMSITPDMKLFNVPDNKQMRIGHFLRWPLLLYWGDNLPAEISGSGLSATLFQPDTWISYQGARRANGHIVLDRIGLWSNWPYTRWGKFPTKVNLTKALPAIHPPDYASHASGSVVFSGVVFGHSRSKVLSILPDRNVQDYVARLGASLIPSYQKVMPETSATKVHFRFYVVQPSGTTFDNEISNINVLPHWLARPSWDDAVLALPNGVILVPISTLTGVRSDAQLAAILSSAIASVLQEQSYIAWYEGSQYGGSVYPLVAAMNWRAFIFGFTLWRDEQAIRIGIRQMYQSGYDIRQAPFAWASAIGKPVMNPVIGPIGKDQRIPWYTAYAFNYISQYYSNVDYSKLKRGRAEYAAFLKELRKADPDAFKKSER